MILYAYMCVFAHSRFVENPPIWSWETNSSFLRWFCHTLLPPYLQSISPVLPHRRRSRQTGTLTLTPSPITTTPINLLPGEATTSLTLHCSARPALGLRHHHRPSPLQIQIPHMRKEVYSGPGCGPSHTNAVARARSRLIKQQWWESGNGENGLKNSRIFGPILYIFRPFSYDLENMVNGKEMR
jgi:hypothetical protein